MRHKSGKFWRRRPAPLSLRWRRGRGGGLAATAAAITEGKRMDKILTLLILLLEIVKRLLDLLH
ncbi:hypothetical protein TSO352_13825 [Azospirillum sp. TSO35-2]|nr:hypothetical protein TSO352_13825 [Azospirillum sp. TSO35-2]